MNKHEKYALDSLLSRASTDALTIPAPKGEELDEILSAVMRAPDHGRLAPWRLVVVKGEARAKLADRVVASMRRLEPEPDEKKMEKRHKRFSTMPMTIILGMHLRPDNKIPLIEQQLAVGAAGMNLLNALHAAGYGAVWVSGDVTYDPVLAEEIGFPAPHMLAGFFFVGTPEKTDHTPKRRPVGPYVARWEGEAISFEADKG